MLRISNAPLIAAALALCAACSQQTEPVAAPEAIEAPAAPPVIEPSIPPEARAFETWGVIGEPVVSDAAASAPDGSTSADTLNLRQFEGIGISDERPVSPGDVRSARLLLWGTPDGIVTLHLSDWCEGTAAEVETVVVYLSSEPAEYEITHTFAEADPCTRFQVLSQTPDPIEVNVWNIRFGS